jgi:hypothetical protein
MLVIDNASPDKGLSRELVRLGDADEHMDVVVMKENDVEANRKVGSLYAAYAVAFAYALERGFDLLHLIQGDFQVLWWDDDVVKKAVELFAAHPSCVNIQTVLFSRDKLLSDEIAESNTAGVLKLRKYGLTDTGLYDLGRWKTRDMHFGVDERVHAQRYLDDGLEVLCHPWPTDAPIPWPAVMRNGRQKGREVRSAKPWLLRPLSSDNVAELKQPAHRTWLEDVCIPWGWICLTPMCVTSVDTLDYWVFRFRDAKKNGLSHLMPRLERRGATWRELARARPVLQHRPPLWQIFAVVPVREVVRRLWPHRHVQWRGRRDPVARARRPA